MSHQLNGYFLPDMPKMIRLPGAKNINLIVFGLLHLTP
jgi:hypothetical protein